LFYCIDPRFYQKIEIFEIQNFNKIPSFTIFFYFFIIFGILFCISPSQTFPKIMEFFVVFYWKKFKKNIDIWNNFFFQNSTIYYLFFYFFYKLWHFIFNFLYLYLSKNYRNFYVFIYYGLETLSKNFEKSWNTFLKNTDIWN